MLDVFAILAPLEALTLDDIQLLSDDELDNLIRNLGDIYHPYLCALNCAESIRRGRFAAKQEDLFE